MGGVEAENAPPEGRHHTKKVQHCLVKRKLTRKKNKGKRAAGRPIEHNVTKSTFPNKKQRVQEKRYYILLVSKKHPPPSEKAKLIPSVPKRDLQTESREEIVHITLSSQNV